MKCPAQESLEKLCRGGMTSEHEEALLEHVGQCRSCQQTIEGFSNQIMVSAQGLTNDIGDNDSRLLRDRLRRLKVQRPSLEHSSTPRYEDLRPWIEDADADIGRVGHYDLIRCIGRGGMGVVFEAFDLELRRAVAVKMMSPALLVDPANSERFLREARAAAAINHPSVVAIHAVSKVRDLPYLVMELVEGESLQHRLKNATTLSMESILEIAKQVADGLAAAHKKGVVHRDIKPANILLQQQTDVAKITDFGLAFTVSEKSLTQTGTLLGTPEYLAPEQINGGKVDHRGDLFSLGSVIYHMCVGQPPFVGQSVVATLRQVAVAEPESLAQASRSVPPWFSELVAQMHEKEPGNRISDAQAVSLALKSRGQRGLKQSRYRNSEKPASKKSLGLPVVVALFAAGAIIACVAAFLSSQSTRKPLIADTAEELIEYLTEHADEDFVVELTSDEPYLLPSIFIEEQTIELIGNEGESLLVFREPFGQTAIECTDGRLELTGIRIELLDEELDPEFDDVDRDDVIDKDSEDEQVEVEPVISCVGGSLVLNDCEIVSRIRTCIELIDADGELNETKIETDVSAIAFSPEEANHLQLRLCTIASKSAILIDGAAVGELTFDGTDLETEVGIEFHEFDSELRLNVEAHKSRFMCEAALFVLYDEQDDPGDRDLMRLLPITWSGSGNHFRSKTLTLFSEDAEQSVNWEPERD